MKSFGKNSLLLPENSRPAARSFADVLEGERFQAMTALVLILTGGALLRMWHLGDHGFWTDELYHAIAARSLLREGTPYIPLMGEYTRAFPFTLIVALSFKLFGVSEFAARLPSVLISLAFILVLYTAVRRLFNRQMALLSALMASFSPVAIELSREARMYPLFQLAFFLMAYFFFTGLEPRSMDGGRRLQGVGVGHLAAAGGLFIFSMAVHELTINFALAVFAYALFMFLYLLPRRDSGDLTIWKYAVVLGCFAAAGAYVLIFRADRLTDMWEIARSIPTFSSREFTDFGYYRHYLSDGYPALFFLYPLSILLMAREYGRKALFFSLLFVVLILAHTFVFGRKLDRYIFYILPFFFLGASYAVWRILRFIWEETRLLSPSTYALGLVSLAVAFNVFGYPWLANSRHVPQTYLHTDWKTLDAGLLEAVRDGTVMTSRYKPYLFYFDDLPEFVIIKDGDPLRDERQQVPRIKGLADLEGAFRKAEGPLYLVLDQWSFRNRAYFDQEMRDFVLAHCDPVLHQGDPKILIFQRKT